MRIPVLFDTDIGSDIDDAVALAYLLAEPRCELLGITTVTGEPVERARLASAVCRAAGRGDVPIHAGTELPLLVPPKQPRAPQKAVLPRWPHQEDFRPGTAVPFLQRTIRDRPGEIVLLAVGPFTNVGLLFALDPEIPRLLRSLVVMGGLYGPPVPGRDNTEWNVSCDPHAAARMFRSPVPEITAYGLDVTLHCRLDAGDCRERFRGGALDVVADAAEVWFGERDEITFHDPLAAVALFDPGVCAYERGTIVVDVEGGTPEGMTRWTPAPDGPHRVAVRVDPDAFFRHYFAVFRG